MRAIPADEKQAILQAVETLCRRGKSVSAACKAAGVSRASYDRWLRAYTEAGVEGLSDHYDRCGRKPLAVPTAEEILYAQSKVVAYNRADGAGSISAAAYALAQWEGCSEDTRDAILKRRASVHTLTPTLRKAFAVDETVIRYARDPREVEHSLANQRGCMRRGNDGRRLRSGKRESWDDGSVNLLVCVPWPMADDECSRRYGVKLGRFQLLCGIDHAYPYCPGFDFTMRPRQSYRGEDVCRAMGRVWAATGKPEEVVLERGVWESKRVMAFLAAAGVRVIRATKPNHKLIENYFHPVWTLLGDLPGQIGRFRGEMRENSQVAEACKAGRVDPRKHFPMLDAFMNGLEKVIQARNTTPSESSMYGNFIPAEVWEEEAKDRPRLPGDLSHFYSGEIKEWTVGRGGSVGGSVMSPFGVSIKYFFDAENLWKYQGQKVRVYFDPFYPENGARVEAMESSHNSAPGDCIAERAECVNNAPRLVKDAKEWKMDYYEESSAEAVRIRKAKVSAIRSETRALTRPGVVERTSSVADGDGGYVEIRRGEESNFSAGRNAVPEVRASAATPARQSRGMPASFGVRGATPEKEDTTDYDALVAELDAEEARMREEGLLV
jgi:transposase-like protein